MTGTRSRRLKGNLPAETTSFIGRRGEVTKAKRLPSTARLVTLTGVAGVGKTRLALRVAAQLQQLHERFPDGVWLVELAALTDDKLLLQAVADVLGIQDQSARPQLDTLADHLADKRLLLVLDNCEHLVDACAILVDQFLRAAPDLRVLATSRHALRAAGEHLLAVAPLPMPDLTQVRSLPTRYAAVRLFGERAAAALPGFRVDAGNRDTIARICHRLDGIPLAIELAAVRVRALPVHQILRRLDDYFEFLAEGSRVSVPRLRTLRATIDWSFDLCSVEEQEGWARLSEFIGGFDLDAAEAVCADEADTAAALSMTEESRRLAQRLDDESALGHAIRVAGLATFFQDDVPGGAMLLEEALACFRGVDDRSGVWITLLQLTGMIAILEEPVRAVDLGKECLDLSHTRAHLSRSWALWGLAISRWLTGDRQAAGRLIHECIRIYQPSNRWSLVHSIEILAWITAAEGQYRRAARLFGAADPIWRSTGVLPATLRHLAPSNHQCEQQTRQSLGDETFAVAFREGTRLTTDEAIAYALEAKRS